MKIRVIFDYPTMFDHQSTWTTLEYDPKKLFFNQLRDALNDIIEQKLDLFKMEEIIDIPLEFIPEKRFINIPLKFEIRFDMRKD